MIIAIVLLLLLAAAFFWFHITNPYAKYSIFKAPYRTTVAKDGTIDYVQQYVPRVWHSTFANYLGYYGKSAFLILQNTFFGGRGAEGSTSQAIIRSIHARRFDPSLPYLISGDQFSVLYPRNLGVFYNQLLDPNTALNAEDWENRQRIYLQSVLVAIDGLSASKDPRTTVIPMGPRHFVLTQVHPGGTGSDQVYGLLYAITTLLKEQKSQDGRYKQHTRDAALRVVQERKQQLQHIYDCYLQKVYHPDTKRIRHDLHLASARDGAIRSGSLYDNIVLYEAVRMAENIGLSNTLGVKASHIHQGLKDTYWNAESGYYNDDLKRHTFSADFLIGYVTGFFDLKKPVDLERTKRVVEYVESHGLAAPIPIRYQLDAHVEAPFFVRNFVPNYGSSAIWSYWGAQYITLLIDLAEATGNLQYRDKAAVYIDTYKQYIVRDSGFAETFDTGGKFLKIGIYKSIRVTGWVVQFEHAMKRLEQLDRRRK